MTKERVKRARKPVSEMAVEIAKFGEAEGNYLERRDPAKAVKALEMLAEDALEIAEGLRLLQKEKMRMLAEDPEQLARTNIRDLSIPWGIANDKFLAAVGENKVVVEHKSAAPSLEDAMKAIQEAREKLKLGSVEILTKDITNEPSDSSG